MNRPMIRIGLVVAGALAAGQSGCQQTPKTQTPVAETKSAAPGDPTTWSDKDVSRANSDSGAGDSGLPKSSAIGGSWSSEGRDIEKSLGVGR